jgi:hypothetical protein
MVNGVHRVLKKLKSYWQGIDLHKLPSVFLICHRLMISHSSRLVPFKKNRCSLITVYVLAG